MFTDAEKRENEIAQLFREAQSARTVTDEYWQKMRSYYSGTHETARKTGAFLASVNIPWKPAQIADGYMHENARIRVCSALPRGRRNRESARKYSSLYR